MMQKYASAFLTIGEVADTLDIPQHVLRYWETRFSQIKPIKKQRGRRYYRPEDVDLLRGIRFLLYAERFTIRGVQCILTERGKPFVSACWQRDSSTTPVWQQTEHSEPQKPSAPNDNNHLKVGALFDEPHRAEPQFEEPLANDAGGLQVQRLTSPMEVQKTPVYGEPVGETRAKVEVATSPDWGVEDTQQPPVTFPKTAFEEKPLQEAAQEGVSFADASRPTGSDAPSLESETQLASTNHALYGEVSKLKSLLSDLQGMRDSYRKLETLRADPDHLTKAG